MRPDAVVYCASTPFTLKFCLTCARLESSDINNQTEVAYNTYTDQIICKNHSIASVFYYFVSAYFGFIEARDDSLWQFDFG